MATSKLAFVSLILLFALLVAPAINADAADDEGFEAVPAAGSDSDSDSSALRAELDQLKSKIRSLESLVDERSGELKIKDELIAEKEKTLQDKSDKVASLQDEMSSLQKKGKVVAAEEVAKAEAHAKELEKQIDKLKKDLETQQSGKGALESRAAEAENKMVELNSKLEQLQKTSDEQKGKILKTERALKAAEEDLMNEKLEASSKIKELSEAHNAWLPPWLAEHCELIQTFVEKHWNESGKPVINLVLEKTMETKSQAEKWAEPHVEIIKTKVVPTVKEQWVVVTTSLEPHVKTLTKKSAEVYETSKTAVTPHVIKVQQVVDPYYQEAKKISKPYIDQVATAAKPHVDKAKVTLEPYTKGAVRVYGKFLESASTYHKQVQDHVRETLKKHELTRHLATKEFEWFAASALLALPVVFLSRICSALFCKKAKKPGRHGHSHHGKRKGKRGHPDHK